MATSTRRSAMRSSPPIPSVTKTISIPDTVVNNAQTLLNYLWDQSCPFGSLFLWLTAFMALYYLFWLPNQTVSIENGTTIVSKNVNNTLRGWLFLATIVSGIIGYMVIRKGCVNAGPGWSVLWFIVALVITSLVTQVILAAAEKISLPNADKLLQQLNKQS